MAEVNLPSWSEISQASEGLRLTSTAATWENILARLARIESRLLEHERRAASTRPPLRPEPDPPDGPLLYAAAQPQFQITCYQPQPPNTHQPPYVPPRQTTADPTAPNPTPQFHQPPSPYQQPLLNQPPPQSPRNAFNAEDQFVNMPYRMATAWDLPETHIVLEPQAVRQTSCWDHPALRSHQGYHSYEQPIVVQLPLPQRLPYCWNPLSHHCSPTALLPAAVAAPPLADDSRQPLCLHITSAVRKIMVEEEHCDEPARVPSMNSIFETEAKEVVDRDVATFDIGDVSNPTIGLPSDTHGIGESRDGCNEDQQVSSIEEMFLLCSPVLCGKETSMLDDEEEKGFLVHLMSSRVKGEEFSYNEKGSFLDEIGDSQSTLLDDNHANKATFDVDEFIEMGPQSVKLRDDLDLDLCVGDVTGIVYRSTSLDADARFIPPRIALPCLSVLGYTGELFVLAWNFANYIGSPLMIFVGGDEWGRLDVRFSFDPGGGASPTHLLSTLLITSWIPP